MPATKPNTRGSRVTGSVIAGLILVPASAIAAVAIAGTISSAPSTEAVEEVTTTETPVTTQVATIETSTTTEAAQFAAAVISDPDLDFKVCTDGADDLIARELNGTITELEAAALDALRQICVDAGVPIQGPPTPEPIIEVVTVVAEPDTSVVAAPVSTGGYDDHDDDDHDDDDHDDDDHDDDDHDDDDHDDDDHDDDDYDDEA